MTLFLGVCPRANNGHVYINVSLDDFDLSNFHRNCA